MTTIAYQAIAAMFADGTPLAPETLVEGRDAGILGTHGPNNGWALTEYGRSLLNGMQPPGDSASCPDEDSYWPPSKATVHQPSQEARAPATQRRPKPAPLMCNPTPPEASALDVQPDGDHYKGMAIQPVQFIEANNIRFLEGCIIKRACRHGSKSGAGAKDLRKIIHEAQLLLELRYGEEA
jgi:hypothetical protein